MDGSNRNVSLLVLTAVFCSGFLLGGMALAGYQRARRRHALRSKLLPNPLDPASLRYSAHEAIELLINYDQELFHLDSHTHHSAISPGSTSCPSDPFTKMLKPGAIYDKLPSRCPQHSESWTQILADVRDLILPNCAHGRSPHFFGCFKVFASEPAVVGELIAAQVNADGSTWLANPAGTELEQRVMEWCRQLFGFPASFCFNHGGGGVLQGTASESLLCAMIAARQNALRHVPQDQKALATCKLVVYATDQTHDLVHRACLVVGLDHLRRLPTTRNACDDDNFALDPQLLAQEMANDVSQGLVPFFVVSTIGTTATTAVEPILKTVKVARAQQHHVWVHVDAAYAGVLAACPEFRHWFNGVKDCDSICVNAHKWMLVGSDCSLFWLRDRVALNDALTLTPSFLRDHGNHNVHQFEEINFQDLQVPIERRCRALKLWFTLRRFGVSGLQTHIRRTVQFAHKFARLLQRDGRFQLFVPTRMGLVCFYVATDHRHSNHLTVQLLQRVNATGRIFLESSRVENVTFLRMSVGGLEVVEANIMNAFRVITEQLDQLLEERRKRL